MVAVATILLGMALLVVGSATQGGASAGGFILIGPIPFVFGAGPSGSVLALLAVVVGVMMVVVLLYYSMAYRSQQVEDEEIHK